MGATQRAASRRPRQRSFLGPNVFLGAILIALTTVFALGTFQIVSQLLSI